MAACGKRRHAANEHRPTRSLFPHPPAQSLRRAVGWHHQATKSSTKAHEQPIRPPDEFVGAQARCAIAQVRSSAGFQPAFRSRLEVCATTAHRAPHQHSPCVTHVLKLECYPCPDRTPHPISPFTILPSLFFLAPRIRESLHYRPCCQPQHAPARAKPEKLRPNRNSLLKAHIQKPAPPCVIRI